MQVSARVATVALATSRVPSSPGSNRWRGGRGGSRRSLLRADWLRFSVRQEPWLALKVARGLPDRQRQRWEEPGRPGRGLGKKGERLGRPGGAARPVWRRRGERPGWPAGEGRSGPAGREEARGAAVVHCHGWHDDVLAIPCMLVDQGHQRAFEDHWSCSVRLGEVADPGLRVGHTPEQQAGGIAGGTLRVVEGEGARDGVAPPEEVCREGAGLRAESWGMPIAVVRVKEASNRVGTTLRLSVTR
jgi:hypothetical protein